ncbi:hypothetical protein [Streptomyces boncukensis]|uniref:Uncharacterized protein n=1 Tax=Streptomyces boncukensis TaxID=2711219 RepID=A0A6G4X0M8_9ACTN|nr:hypothetical protein [Streptomyces boncukensis]NGO71096.1 hypothetical protein [Streptomyces boncukensis]
MAEAFVRGEEHRACGICPSRRLPLGEFDVAERPSREFPFSSEDGHRYTAEGVPVCVHPEKVGVPAARYKSDRVPLMGELDLPADEAELEMYLRDMVHGAAPGVLESLIEQASREIAQRFPGVDTTAMLRRAFMA